MESAKNLKAKVSQLKKVYPKTPEVFPYLADCYLKLGRLKDAGKILLSGLDQYPENYMGWVVQGNLNRKMGKLEEAEDAFQRALQHDNLIPFVHEQCAEIARDMGNADLHVSHLNALNHQNPLDGNVQSMMQAQQLRQIAVESGLYTAESVEHVMPGTLRQKLKNNNLLPRDFERTTPRKRDKPFDTIQTGKLSEEDLMIDASTDIEEELITIEEELITSVPQAESEEQLTPELIVEEDVSIPEASTETPVESVTAPDEQTFDSRRYPLSSTELSRLGDGSSRVAWANTVGAEKSYIQPDVEIGKEGESEGMQNTQFEQNGQSAEESASEGSDVTTPQTMQYNEPDEPRESPIMRLLRGEMQDSPISKDLQFNRETIIPALDVPVPMPEEVDQPSEVHVEDVGEGKTESTLAIDADAPIEPSEPDPTQTAAPDDISITSEAPDSNEEIETLAEADDSLDSKSSESQDIDEPAIANAVQPQPSFTAEEYGGLIQDRIELEGYLALDKTEQVDESQPEVDHALEAEHDVRPEEPSMLSTQTEESDVADKVALVPGFESNAGWSEESDAASTATETTPSEESGAVKADDSPPESVIPIVTQMSPQDQIYDGETDKSDDSTPPAVAPETIEQTGSAATPPTEANDELADVAREITSGTPETSSDTETTTSEREPIKIATKTLAELHASQGNWADAVAVYEELLKKFPDNIAYAKRRDELQAKLESK